MILIVLLANVVAFTWSWSGAIISITKELRRDIDHRAFRPFRWCLAEFRPLYLPAIGVVIIHRSIQGHATPMWILTHVISLATWWWFKDVDKDDRWKRRRAKAAEKVKALASGRLVAVPAGAS